MDCFYNLLGRLEDLDLHLLPAEEPLVLANPMLGLRSALAGTTSSFAATAVVAPGSTRLHSRITLGWMSSSRLTSARVFSPLHEVLHDATFELDRADPPAVCLPCKIAHGAPPSCRSRLAPAVSNESREIE